MTVKHIILLRHAHRKTKKGRHLDNGLSPKGKRQTEKILSFWLNRDIEDVVFVSSPKKRCLETLGTLAQEYRSEMLIEGGLDERCWEPRKETKQAFLTRVNKSLNDLLSRKEKHFVLCSHSDWISEAGEALTGKKVPLKKGHWEEVIVDALRC